MAAGLFVYTRLPLMCSTPIEIQGVGALYFEVFNLAAHVERRLLCRFQVCWAAALGVDGMGHEVGMELVRFLPWKNRRM